VPGRRRADSRPATPADAGLTPRRRGTDVPERGAAAPRTPGEDALAGARQGRSDRRRDGLLPQSEDQLLRRPAERPDGPPPGAGRRRSDAGATAAERPPAPRPSPPVSGPMTSVASPAATVPPRTSAPARPVPARVTAAPPPPIGATGRPAGSTASDAGQRVLGPAPTGSPWGVPVDVPPGTAGEAAQPGTPRAALDRPASVVDRPVPAGAVPPVRPLPGRPGADPLRRVDEGPATGPTLEETRSEAPARRAVDVPVGGRAAARLERQAAQVAAKKSGARRTAPPVAPAGPRGPGRDDDAVQGRAGAPRRAVQGLLGVVVIALVVLGVWSFTSPRTTEIAAQTPVSSAAAPSAVPESPALPSSEPDAEDAEPAAPVKAPITVLNSTGITGLAGKIGEQFTAGGWEVVGTGAYEGDDIAATTVYFTAGDAEQQEAADQLVEQFGPDLTGSVERFFDVPGVDDPGLVVVATGNWRP